MMCRDEARRGRAHCVAVLSGSILRSPVQITQSHVHQILTRTSGFLATVCSHSLQPYRGCALGNSLCGVGCYVQHNYYITRGQRWGSFVEARTNAPDAYSRCYQAERDWARSRRGRFGIFLSSSTEPFQPLEWKHALTRQVLQAMTALPPDFLIIQTHSHRVTEYLDLYGQLAPKTDLRFHISIESDLDRLPGLPPSASSVEKRIDACRILHAAGLRVVVTVSPLLPIRDPAGFFGRLSSVADAVVIDHYIAGDGSPSGARTQRTPLPLAMARQLPRSVTLDYRHEIVETARKHFPGRVGVNIDGFAGRFLAE
jgi:DNA repair photolyase